MSFEDERIVKMTFDNKAFTKNIESTIHALQRLEKTMNLDDVSSSRAFDNFVDGVEESDAAMNTFDGTVNKVKASFSLLQVAGYTAMAELTRYAINAGKKIYNNTLGQIKSGGLTRALNIEAAKFQIEGLGHTWDEVSSDIDYAVKGTAYGLDSAAKAASQLLASQIQAGDQMKVSLRGISGLAAVTNSSYDDIADIFTTVAGNGRLMGDQLNRISYRGINAAQTLMDYFNNVKGITVKTEAEIRDMVSKGKVSFMEFAAAMDYAFGEHAKDANKTFTGAISNMKAALSRIGEKFLTPWNEFERKLAVAIIPVIDRVKNAAELVMPVFNTILDRTASWVEKLTSSYNFQKAILNVTIGIWSWIQNILGALEEMGFHLPEVEDLADLLEKVTSVLVLNAEQGRKVRNVVKIIVKSLSILITIIQSIIYILQPIFKPILSFLKNVNVYNDGVLNKSADIIDKINYIIKVIAILIHIGLEKAIQLVIAAVKILIGVVKAAGGIIAWVVLGISKLVKALKIVVDAIRDYGEKIWNVVKSLGDGFVKFYDLIREIFINIGTGMDKFLENAQDKTSALWKTINSMVGTKKLNIVAEVSTKATTLSPNALVSKNASSNVKDISKQTSQYADNANAAAAANDKLNKGFSGGFATGGGQGEMNKSIAISNALRGALRGVGDGSRDMADQVEQNAGRAARSMGDLADATRVSTNAMVSPDSGSSFADKAAGIFDGFIEKLEYAKVKLDKARDRAAEHFSNFFAVLSDIIILSSIAFSVVITVVAAKLIKTIFAVVNILPQITSALSDAAKGLKYAGMGEAFKGLALALLSLGALLVTIAIISKLVDFADFKKFVSLVGLLIMATSILAFAVSKIVTAVAVLNLINNLSGIKPLTTRITNFISSMKDLFIGLAILIGTIIAGVVVIEELAKRNGGYDEIEKAGMLIAGLILATGAFMLIVTKVIGGSGGVTAMTHFGFKGITREFKSSLSGVISLIGMMIPLIAVLVGSIYLLARQDTDLGRATAAFGIVMGSFQLMFLAITGLMIYINERVKAVDLIDRGSGIAVVMHSVTSVISAVSLFMISFVAAAALLSIIPQEKQDFAFKMMLTQFIFMGAMLLGIGTMVVLLNKSVQKSASGLAKVSAVSSSLKNMALVISSLATAMMAMTLSIAGALAIISIIPSDKLGSSVTTLMALMALMGIIMGLIVSLTKSVNIIQSAGNMMQVSGSGYMTGTGQQVAMIIGSMASMMLTIAGSVALLALIDVKKMWSATGVMAALSVCMTGMLAAVLGLIRTTTGFGGITSGFEMGTIKVVVAIFGGMSLLLMAIASSLYIVGKINPQAMTGALIAFSLIFTELSGAIMGVFLMVQYIEKSFKGMSMTANRLSFIKMMGGLVVTIALTMVALMGSVMFLAIVFDDVKTDSIIMALSTMAISWVMIMTSLVTVLGAISSMGTAKIKMNPKDLINIAAFISVLAGAMSVMMLAFAEAAMILNNVDSVTKAFIPLGALIVIFGGICALIVAFQAKIATAFAAFETLIKFALGLSLFMIAFAGAAYILGKVDWANISANLDGLGAVVLSMIALTATIVVASMAAQYAIKPLLILSAAIVVVVTIIAIAISKILSTYNQLIISLNEMATIDWTTITDNSANLKTVLTNLSDAISAGSKNFVGAALVGAGLYLLIKGLKILETVDANALKSGAEGLKSALEALKSVIWPIIAIVAVTSILGPTVFVGILSLVASLLVVVAAIPLFVSLTEKATESLANSASKISENINKIKEGFDKDKILDAMDALFPLVILGAEMFLAGVLLGIGTAAFLVGAALLLPALALLKLSIEQAPEIIGNIKVFGSAMLVLIGAAIMLVLASAVMGIAVSIALPTFAILLGCTALLCLVLAQAPYILSMIQPMLTAIGELMLVGIGLAALGAEWILGAALVGLAASFLLPVVLLLAGTLAVMYMAVTLFNWQTILVATGLLLMVVGALALIGTAMIVASIPLLLGGALLAVAAILFTIVGVSIAAACVAFLVGVLAIWGIVEIIKMIDFAGAMENMGNFALFSLELIGVGAMLVVLGVILLIAGALLSVAAIFLSVAIITLSISLLIGAALLLAASYILEPALDQLEMIFTSMDFDTLLSGAFQLLIFGAVLGIAGLILLIGSVLLLPGAIILSVGATQLAVALPMLKKAFDKGLKGSEFVKNAALYLASAALMLGAGGMLMLVGPMFTMFAKSFSAAGTSIVNTINSLKDASSFIGDLVDSFADAGSNIIDGITTGIVDNASDVVDSISDVAEGVLDTFCDVLGINSPARELVDRAAYCIAGIAEGLGMDHDEVYSTISGLGNGMLDKFEGFTSGFKSIGESFGDNMVSGFSDKLKSGMKEISSGFLGDMNAMLNLGGQSQIEEELKFAKSQLTKYSALAQSDSGNADVNKFNGQQATYWGDQVDELTEQLKAFETKDYGAEVLNQMGNWGVGGDSGGTDIDYSMLDSATSEALGGSNLGKMATDASKVGGNVGTAITNNTYNFTQNNYSPEPIDRTELYVQTNNQLDTWYKWLRDNN